MGCKRKRLNELNMEKKKEVLDLIDKGVSQRTIAVQFGVAKSTVGNINKNRSAKLKAWGENCSNERKPKLRRTDSENVNDVTLHFFSKMSWNEYSCYWTKASTKSQGNCTEASC
jgi:IS30 family transposase